MPDRSLLTEDETKSGDNLTEYTVSEIAFSLKRTVEGAFGLVRVRGELSGIKRAGSGHLYFALKDDRAVLDGVCWRGTQRSVSVELEDGLEVICTGQLSTYPARSRYQLIVESIEPAGVGALMALLEERRKTFEAEGLFDADRKRALPFLPRTIGIVTSPSGAVIRDILHRIEERFPCQILLWPVMVQGQGAADQIAQAISGFDAWEGTQKVPRPDLLILARGGGSIEDLWSFNEESVVRAVSACRIPLISAVGHETDTTLVDFVSDQRAPTPTAAAEFAVPVRHELLHALEDFDQRLTDGLERSLLQRADSVRGLSRGLHHPENLVGINQQRTDELGERHARVILGQLANLELRVQSASSGLRPPNQILNDHERRLDLIHARTTGVLNNVLQITSRDLERANGRLQAITLRAQIDTAKKLWQDAHERLGHALSTRTQEWSLHFHAIAAMLESLSHRRVLERGYALVRSGATAQLIGTAAKARDEATLAIEFADGEFMVQAHGNGDQSSVPRSKPGGRKRRNQGELF